MSSGSHGWGGIPNPMDVYRPDAGAMPLIGFVCMLCCCSFLVGFCIFFFTHEDAETKAAHERVKARKAAEKADQELTSVTPGAAGPTAAEEGAIESKPPQLENSTEV